MHAVLGVDDEFVALEFHHHVQGCQTRPCKRLILIRTSGYSYTPAGQNRLSGALYFVNDTVDGMASMPSCTPLQLGPRTCTHRTHTKHAHLDAQVAGLVVLVRSAGARQVGQKVEGQHAVGLGVAVTATGETHTHTSFPAWYQPGTQAHST